MRPIQVWLPELVANQDLIYATKDRESAYRLWNGEDIVWFMPGLNEPRRWAEDGVYHLAVPANDFDRAFVYHIADDGEPFGPHAAETFSTLDVPQLLNSWLNWWGKICGFAPSSLSMKVPDLKRAQPEYREEEILIGPRVDSADAEEDTDEASIFWGASAIERVLASPPGSPKRPQRLHSLSQSDEMCARLAYSWPEPIGALMPKLASEYELSQQLHFRDLALASDNDPEGVRDAVKKFSGTYLIEEGTTLRGALEFKPMLHRAKEEGFLMHMEGKYNIEIESLQDLDRPDFRRLYAERIPIRVAWGPLGLFWALLLDRLENYTATRECRGCGVIFAIARRNQLYCGDADCSKARARRRQRKTRTTKRSNPIENN